MVKRHLAGGSTLLKGGCGRGQLIRALRLPGYRAIRIDFAQRTVKAVHEAMPELSAIMADVRHFPLEEASLDGYLSVGVIEHLWEGYGPILAEMARTVRPGGFSFVSFPCMSFLRRLKVRLGAHSTGTKEQYLACRDSFHRNSSRGGGIFLRFKSSALDFPKDLACGDPCPLARSAYAPLRPDSQKAEPGFISRKTDSSLPCPL
jgi:SAM-dependent methyltransferase